MPTKKIKNLFISSVHPWRLCPMGEHWVSTHPMRVPPSKSHPNGYITTRHNHCAKNPSGKDELYPDEIGEIAKNNFQNVKPMPCSIDLGFKGQGDKYDSFIAGWTKYCNDVLQPKIPLDPNMVKALIASESGFNPKLLANPKNSNSGRGLMQVLNSSRSLLGGDHGDLKDHFLTVTKSDLNDPNINICAGIRWLFEKQRLASSHIKKDASWIDTIMNYKGNLKKSADNTEAAKEKRIFKSYLAKLEKCEK